MVNKETFLRRYIEATKGRASSADAEEVYERCEQNLPLNVQMLERVADFQSGTVQDIMRKACLTQAQVNELPLGAEIYFTAVDPVMRGIGKFKVCGRFRDKPEPWIDYTGNGEYLTSVGCRQFVWTAEQ